MSFSLIGMLLCLFVLLTSVHSWIHSLGKLLLIGKSHVFLYVFIAFILLLIVHLMSPYSARIYDSRNTITTFFGTQYSAELIK